MHTTLSNRTLSLGRVLALAWATAFVLGGTAAFAQTCTTDPPARAKEAVSALATLARDRCLAELPGGCQTDACKKFEAKWLLPGAALEKSHLASALEELIDEAAKVTGLPAESGRVSGRMALYLAELTDADIDPLGPASVMFRVDPTLQSFQGDSDFTINWPKIFERECTTPQRCSEAFGATIALLEKIVLFRRVIATAQAADAMALASYVRRLDDRWQHYLLSGRAQYPWELSINSLFRPTGRGLVEPPTHQFILLHPSAGYEIASGGEARLSESLVLELVGLYRFRWAEEQTSPVQLSGFGFSILMAARSSSAGEPSVGYGAMAYLPRGWAIGYVWRPRATGDDHAILLNADLAKLFMKGESLRQRVRRLTSH